MFFPKITKYPGQEERYDKELKQQQDLAAFVLSMLMKRGVNVTVLVRPANLSRTQFHATVVETFSRRCLYVAGPFEDKAGMEEGYRAFITAVRWAEKFGYVVVQDDGSIDPEELWV